MIQHKIEFTEDRNIDQLLNAKLQAVLSECFPNQNIFKIQRYYKEIPAYRWFILDDNKIIAHTALHIKEIFVNDLPIKIGGIAEVCVLPEFRKMGLAKLLLSAAEDWLKLNGFKYVMLFGEEKFYSSSGYLSISNEIKLKDFNSGEIKIKKNIDAMIKLLSDENFPNGLIDLNGYDF